MDRLNLKRLLREVLGPNHPTEDHDHWIGIACPYARWTHASGKDSKPSAGLSVHRNGTSIFRCFTCCPKGLTLERFLRRLDTFTGDVPASLIRDAADEEFFGGDLLPWGETDEDETDKGLNEPLDKETYLDLYDPAGGHRYLKFRGINDETAFNLELMVDPADSEGDERILFPVYAPNGDLHGFTGRATSKHARLKVRDYHGLKKSKLLLGAHAIDRKRHEYVVVVEGLFDYAMLRQYDLPVVASMMATVSTAQADILRYFGLPVISMYDDDDAGDKGTESLTTQLSKHVPVLATAFPDVKVRDRETGERRWAKDPDELGRDHIMEMIENAELT